MPPRRRPELDAGRRAGGPAFAVLRAEWPEPFLSADDADELLAGARDAAAPRPASPARDVKRGLRRALTGRDRGVALPHVIAAIERDDAIRRATAAGDAQREHDPQALRQPYRSRRARSSPCGTASCPIYSCGPTVYSYIHVGNARPFVVAMTLKRHLERRHPELGAARRHQHHRRQREDLRRRAGRRPPERRASARGDGAGVHRRHGPAGPGAPRPRAARDRDGAGDRRADRAARGARSRLRRRTATSTSASARSSAYGGLSGQRTGEPARGGPRRARRGQGVAARLRALEGAQGGRGQLVAQPVGRRAARAGTSSAPRWPCASSARSSTCTAAGST